jgi:hypothetical protein
LGFLDYWPHVVVMIGLSALAFRAREPIRTPLLLSAIALSSVVLATLYRSRGSLAPPMHERIGLVCWLAIVLTAAVPLITVWIVALRSRAVSVSSGLRVVTTAGAGLLALALYPLYGMLIYCGFTGSCP